MRPSAVPWTLTQIDDWVLPQPSRENWLARKQRGFYPAGDLEDAINRSRKILELPANWDDAGSPSIGRETWERAATLLRNVASYLWAVRNTVLPAPHIAPGSEGSIDLHWKTPQRELLVSIPADLREAAPYYGDDYGSDKKKGVINPGNLSAGLFAWLTLTD